jgi:RNA polymerase sigma factor (sigma-70 family)
MLVGIAIAMSMRAAASAQAARAAGASGVEYGWRRLAHDRSLLDLYLVHRSALIEYAVPIVGSRVVAEDIVQDAYLRLARPAGGSDQPIANPLSYLYRIVRNLALDHRRRAVAEGAGVRLPELVHALAAPASTPEDELLHRQQLRLIAAALAELPERTRIAFEMHRLGGFTLQQIAGALGISVTLVHQLVRSAITHAAGRLDDRQD